MMKTAILTAMEKRSYLALFLMFIHFAIITCSLDCSKGLLKSYPGSETEDYVKFSVILSVRRPGEGNTCGTIIESQLQVLAAIHWTVQKINDGGLLPFAKLGYTLYDDCGIPWYTTQGLQSLYGCHPSTNVSVCSSSSQVSCTDIGLVGLSRNMADYSIKDFTSQNKIPVVSPFTTEGGTPANIRTTRPQDVEQVKLLVRMLKEFGWSYFTVVHTDDHHSQSRVELLKELARNESICVDVLGSIPAVLDEQTKIDQMVDKVRKARQEADSGTLGVVYLGNGYKGTLYSETLKGKVQTFGETNSIQLFLSEDLNEWTPELIVGSDLLSGSLLLRTSETVVTEFEEKYASWVSESNETTANSPLKEFLEELSTEPSPVTNFTRNRLVSEAMDGIYTLAVAYLKAQQDKCGTPNPSTNCQALKKMSGEELSGFVNSVNEKYADIHPQKAVPEEFRRNSRQIALSSGLDVVLFNDSQNMYKIASWEGNVFKSNLNYQVPVSRCHGPCPICAPESRYQYAYVDGDILLMGVFPVHSSKIGSPFECGEFKENTIHGVLPEAFLYGLAKIRERTGIKFGAVAFDSCESSSRTLLTVSDFMVGDVQLTKPGTSEIIDPKKVRLVVGGYNSGVTVPLAMFFTNLNIPVVSYASSTPDLDDRLTFPYFLRSVPSDVEQAQAMVNVIKAMDWQYVSLLYVDNNYGTKGKQAFIDIATEKGICITQPPLALSQVRKENEDNDVLTQLRNQKPEVVVLFVIEERVAQFLDNQQEQFQRIGLSDNFIYLASEDWGQSQHVLNSGKARTLGSITLKLGSSNAADKESFAEYMKEKTTATQLNYNPFFNELWANEFQCSPDTTLEGSFPKGCSEGMRIPGDLANEWENSQRVVHILNAMFAIGDGIKQERDKLCNGDEEFICQALIDHPKILTESIRNARFFESGKEFAVFGENGNGVTGFDVLNVQKDVVGSPHYVKIGSFSNGELILDKSKLTFYDGDIKAQCGPDQCQDCKRPTGTSEDNTVKCSNMSVDDLQVRSVDLVIIVILAVVCVVLIAKLAYNAIRSRRAPSRKKSSESISMADLTGTCANYSGGSMNYSGGSMNYSGGGKNYSGGSMNYSGGSIKCIEGTLPPPGYDKPPPPKRFVRDDWNERYCETPTNQSNLQKENCEYLHPESTRKTESHIYNTTNLERDGD